MPFLKYCFLVLIAQSAKFIITLVIMPNEFIVYSANDLRLAIDHLLHFHSTLRPIECLRYAWITS